MAALSLLLHLVPRCLGARNPQLREADQNWRVRPGVVACFVRNRQLPRGRRHPNAAGIRAAHDALDEIGLTAEAAVRLLDRCSVLTGPLL